ncbi:MAG: PolC-type DNA polymerase III [Mycoplasma sp.]|nr:PolC-type DNA polymerase III [Candidatus Hennigella equi]
MNNVPKEYAKNFFLEAKILAEDEIDLIIDSCSFGIEMPDDTNDNVTIYIITDKVLPTRIYNKLTNFPNEKLDIVIKSNNLSEDYSKLNDYIQIWLKENHPNSFILQDLFQETNYVVDNAAITVKYVSTTELEQLKKISKDLVQYLNNIHFAIKEIKYHFNQEKQNRILEEERVRKHDLAELIKQSQKMVGLADRYDRIYKVSGLFTDLKDINDEYIDTVINISGEIVSLEKKEPMKLGAATTYIFVIYDYAGGAFKCSYRVFNTPPKYESEKKRRIPQAYMDTFKVGEWISVNCKVESNKYTGFEPAGTIYRLCHSPRPEHLVASDDAKEKRVELLMHSNMTAYEGIDSAESIFKHAQQCGYDSIAILERNNVQSIPDIFKASKNYPSIKPLYGCEFEVIDRFIPIVVNPIDKSLQEADYVVFDIETTGLYPQFDDLIEFGAIKYSKGEITDRIDFFVKPTKPLTNVAINLSHITNDMVENAIGQKEALLKIKQWIGNDVLIAHNGIRFDLNFLNKLCERFNVEPIKNCLIDTLEISHAVNKKLSKHTLGTLVGKLRVEYNPLEAHRADKDSEYLLEVWKYFIRRLCTQDGIDNIKDINNKLQTASLRASRRGYFVDVYAKNQEGLRDLFKLLSLALTKQLYQKDDDDEVTVLTNGQPKLHFDNFDQYRKNLVICPSPFDGDVWESAISETQNELENKIKKYDYIFIAPAKNIEHLEKQDKIKQVDVNKALAKIIETSNKLDKKVCAVSDAYYLMPYERQIHEVYVYTKQLGGKRNPLYRHDGSTYIPDLHLMTTQQMLDAFSFVDKKIAKEIVVTNTQQFAHDINQVIPINDNADALCKPEMPDAEKKLKDLVWSNAKRIYGEKLDKEIEDRINKELTGICSKGYEVIYWISHLLIEKSNKDGYIVGSRGSVGSSIVAFLSNISEVNPLPPHYVCPKCKHYEAYPDTKIDGFDLPPKKCPVCGQEMSRDGHNIPFSSFLGVNADKLPDIDLNFSGEYQAKAHEFIRDMFGKDHAFRAGTIGTVADKTAIGFVKSYFEQIDPNTHPSSALVTALSKKCAGVKRTTGQHPGGIIVVPEGHDITEFTPFNYPSNDKTKGWLTTHFEYHCLENNLLKFDILGHDEPTILKHLHDITKIDPRTIPNHDDKVLELFATSKDLNIVDEKYDKDQIATMALPEFGTTLTRRIVSKTKPTSVGDLIRISGLSHGTGVWQGNAEDLVAHGVHLGQVAACREDIFHYLVECGMEQNVAFKTVEFIRKNKNGKPLPDNFVTAMKDAHVPEWYIDSCRKIRYLFPKAHATAYVLDAIRTAWYKVYYPAQFYAVWFSIRSDVFDIETIIKGPEEVERLFKDYKSREKDKSVERKLTNKQIDLIPIFEVCLEMFARGINVKNIDINKSQATDFVVEGNSIIAPFTSLDGLGKEAADSIIAARNEKPFSSVADLQKRTKLSTTLIGKLQELHVLDNLDVDDQLRLF